ncbi:MAG: hypothetical protein U0V70_06645 [Terriglobia bacterium]
MEKRFTGNADSPVNSESIQKLLRKIMASAGFIRSDRMSRFLKFIVEQTLQGHGDRLKEYLIGVEVFDRGESFDPRTDPVVRGEARRLRLKLKEYYDVEGGNDPIRFHLPKGSYVPSFESLISPFSQSSITNAPSETLKPRVKAIAVLPFVNLSSDPENEYFSDGLTEEIIHALGKIEGMSVVARTSVFQFKGKAYDVRILGEQLNVQTVLEGSVRKAGDRFRVTAQLINCSDGYHLLSETFEREMKDVFAIQDEISRAIVKTLRQIYQPGNSPFSRSGTNLDAYQLYLKGRFYCRKRTEEGIKRSIEFFHQATEVDPEYAAAYGGLAEAFSLFAHKGLQRSHDIMPKVKSAALKALELDPQVPEAHMALGFVRSVYDWEWESAERHYIQALEYSSYGNVEAQHWYATDYLAPLGRLDEALQHIQHALFVDPLSHLINSSLGFVLISRREYEQAIEQFQKGLYLDPHFYHFYTGLGRSHMQLGMFDDALRFFHKARELSGDLPYVIGLLAHCYAVMGEVEKAESLKVTLLNLSQERHVPSMTFALLYSALHKPDEAFRWLEKAFAERECPLAYLNVYPTYESLRTDERVQELIRKLGVAPAARVDKPMKA